MDIQQRLDVFFRRLADAPPAANAEEALRLVCRLIEEVEEEFCPMPREQPAPLTASGRMYAPKQDHTLLRDDGHIVAQTRHHEITCFPDGAIEIVHTPRKTVVLSKCGNRT